MEIRFKEIEPTTIIAIPLILVFLLSFLYRLDMAKDISYYQKKVEKGTQSLVAYMNQP